MAKTTQESLRSFLFSFCSMKFFIYFITVSSTIFILIETTQFPPLAYWDVMHQLEDSIVNNHSISTIHQLGNQSCRKEIKSVESKLKESVTFLPLKDLRYSKTALQGHTWFMSSMYDTHEKGEVQYQEFPAKASEHRVLCLKGTDTHDGSWNSYALAWPQALPHNATLMKGLTFVSYNHYNYDNIRHGLSAIVPFIAWHIKNQCSSQPMRWVLYHWGELRTKMGPWLSSLTEAIFESPLHIEKFDEFTTTTSSKDGEDENAQNSSACFERAVVMRHNEGGMSRERRLQVYDYLRCKARIYCNVSFVGRLSEINNDKGFPVIGMTLFMRTGPRSFKNDSAVIEIFQKACYYVRGCRIIVAYANNLTFCEQVKLMSETDILVSPHGAQLTNMFLMDRNSSVMEFFPKGWLELAGIGQYVYHWISSWSGMKHRGAWRDPNGDSCPFSEDNRRCMKVYKNARIGHNESYFYEWARDVLDDVKLMKEEYIMLRNNAASGTGDSSCDC